MKTNGITFAQMVEALGCEEVDPNITEENFPIPPRNRDAYDLDTICFDEFMSPYAARTNLAAQGLEPGDFADLCEYGTKNPDEQKEHTIKEIGSIWDGDTERHRFMAALSTRDKCDLKDLQIHKVRTLELHHDGGHFPGTHILIRRPK